MRTEEFQGKIAAAIATRKDPDFLVIARTESPDCRPRPGRSAGPDLRLCGGRRRHDPRPLKAEGARRDRELVRAWSAPTPLVIVPTTYPPLNEARIRALGKIAMVIYGNHAIRAAVTAMQQILTRIRHDGGIEAVDADIVTVDEIFRLQGMDAARASERKFLR